MGTSRWGSGTAPAIAESARVAWLAGGCRAFPGAPLPRPVRPSASGATARGHHVRTEPGDARKDSHARSDCFAHQCHRRSTQRGCTAIGPSNQRCVVRWSARSVEGADARAAGIPGLYKTAAPGWSSAGEVQRRRMERAAKRWGIAERVRFEGWLPRDVLLSRLATAGVLLHPALHEEAGLCVAEALALGTPAVCLDHGGPPEILREWPQTPSAAVPPRDPETTARGLAHAIDHFLDQPPPVRAVPQASATSFKHELLAAYDAAIATRGRRSDAVVWAFPRGKPQLFTATPRALSEGVAVYAFGRRIPRIVQTGIAVQIRVPGIRRLVAERHPQIEPICGWDIWDAIAERLQHCGGATSREWIHLHSQWDKPRSSVIALSPRGRPEFFLTIESIDNRPRGPLSRVPSFRVPACIDAFSIADWSVRQYQLVPPFHRPVNWDPARIRQVAADASRALAGALERCPEIPPHWQPMHGDLVPWNLREDERGQLWLLDWEDAGWGPPFADLVRFIVAYDSLNWRSPATIAARVRSVLTTESAEALDEIARFWLQHHNLRPVQNTRNWKRQKAKDAARGARELTAFRALLSTPPAARPV